MGSGNQHGNCECNDLQNWLHMTSHEKPLYMPLPHLKEYSLILTTSLNDINQKILRKKGYF